MRSAGQGVGVGVTSGGGSVGGSIYLSGGGSESKGSGSVWGAIAMGMLDEQGRPKTTTPSETLYSYVVLIALVHETDWLLDLEDSIPAGTINIRLSAKYDTEQ